MPSALRDAFARVAAADRDRPAIIVPDVSRSVTFAQALEETAAVARALASARLPASPCLIAHAGNHRAFVPLLLAALDAGAAVILLDGDASAAQADDLARALGADAIVVPAVPAGADVHPLAAGLGWRRGPAAPEPQWRRAGDRGVVLKLTSGSTETPRAVVATEANLVSDVEQISEAMDIRSTDVNLAAIPMSHSYGLGNLVLPLIVQGTPLVLRPRFSPRDVAADVAAFGVTTLPGVPYVFEHLHRHGQLDALRGVRRLITAGAPIPPATVDEVQRRTGRRLHSFYGTSETGGISYDASDDVRDPPTVGQPLPRTTIELRAGPYADGAGRVFVRGPAVAARYAIDDDALAAGSGFRDGGFLTGDLGRIDARGRLTLSGRVSPFINVAGRKVDPAEVEAVLRAMPGIADAIVVGAPCDHRGEMVIACVRARQDGLSVLDVRAFCASRLAAHKLPRRLAILSSWPVDARGKVDRRALAALAATAPEASETGATIIATMASREQSSA